MYCQNCGSKVTDGSLFCHACGAKLDAPAGAEQAKSFEQQAQEPQQAQPVYTAQPTAQPEKKSSINGWSIASLICGILGFIFPIIVFSILAIVFASISEKHSGTGRKDGMAMAGFVLGIISLIFSIIVIIVAAVAVAAVGSMFGLYGMYY